MYNILYGKPLQDEIFSDIKKENISNVLLATILVGNNPASSIYINAKKKAVKSVGFLSRHAHFPKDVSEKKLLQYIKILNDDNEVHGILVQLPLPNHINEDRIIKAISVDKDVDGFHPYNQGLLQKSFTRESLTSCTPTGIMRLLDYYEIDTKGQHAVVLGRSNIVGRPIATMLSQKKNSQYGLCGGDATVTLAHSKSRDVKEITLMADLLIVAIGSPHFITVDMVKKGAVVIDVGINRNKQGYLIGDVDFETVRHRTSAITPVPGGVGLITIAILMENTLKAYKKIKGKNI